MGEDILQRWIAELLRPLLQLWFTSRGIVALVGADQFIYYRKHDAHKRVAPDIYVLPGVPPDTHVRAWKIWETGIAPSFALEIVSRDWEKDYTEAQVFYDAAGVGELVVFDPAWAERSHGIRWQVFRRLARRGLVRVEASNGDRVRARSLGCWLRVVGDGRATRVRLGTGPNGDDLVPTAEEAERAAKEAERAAKEAALLRVAELEVLLAARPRRHGAKRR